MRYKLDLLLQLAKVKITAAVSITTITGYILYKHGINRDIILPTLGIFLLACGSSVINHIQEYKTDMIMERTKKRPLPTGQIAIWQAWLFASVLVLTGSSIIFTFSGIIALYLGLTALIWYNLIYTNLKKITFYAVIPGSVIGAIPPLVGWVTAGGHLNDIRAYTIALFFFVWQVPHFWLLMLKYGEQYKNAGFPTITESKTPFMIRLLTFIWTISTAISALFLPYFEVIHSKIAITGIIIASIWLIVQFVFVIINKKSDFSPGKFFMKINYYVLAVIIFLVTDHILPI